MTLIEEEEAGSTSTYPLADAHGDITTITDQAAAVSSRQIYDPWGTQNSGPALEMGYLGGYERRSDPITGLTQMGVRPYDAVLARFLHEDPVLGRPGFGQSLNRQAYVEDNPLNRYDLDGRVSVPSPGEVVNGVGDGLDAVGDVADDGWDATAGARDFAGREFEDFWKDLQNYADEIAEEAGQFATGCAIGAAASQARPPGLWNPVPHARAIAAAAGCGAGAGAYTEGQP